MGLIHMIWRKIEYFAGYKNIIVRTVIETLFPP